MCAKKSLAKPKKTVIFSNDFYSDMRADGMLYALIVRSPFESGKISSIQLENQEPFPENYEIFTAGDIPNQKFITTFGTHTEIFCTGEIKYKGEPVALIAGPEKEKLFELRKKIQISVSQKDSEKIPEGNDKAEQIQNGQKEEKEIAAEREVLSGDAQSEFENSENKIIEGTWENSVTQHEIKETAGCYCVLKGENLHIFTASRYITHIKDSVSRATGIDKGNIILNCTKKNNRNSNQIWMSSIFAAMASVAAAKTGKPVLLALERDDETKFIERATPVKVKNKAAVSKDGTIKAMEIEIEADTGYKNPLAEEMLDRFSIAAAGIYSTENLKITTKIFSSANPPSSIRLNRIDAQVFFALESQIQKICEETGFTPLEIRLKNLKKQKNSKNPFAFELGRAEDSMKAVCSRSDFNRKYAVYKLAEKGRYETDENSPYSPPLRGIGMAAAFDGNGYLGTNFKNENFSMQVTMSEDRKIFVNTAPPSQNIREIWQKIIIDSLGADKRSIQFNLDLSLAEANEKGITAIQNDLMIGNISIKTHLLKKCIEAIKRKKEPVFPFTVKKSISPSKRNQWNEETFSGTPFFSTSFGACVVEVEYDSRTFSEQVTGVFAVIDCGKIANPQAAETTAKQTIKKCLATLVSGDSLKSPKIVMQFAQSDEEPKRLDSLIYSILPPAFCSATSQALALTVNSLPLNTDSLFKLKENSEKNIGCA